MNKKITPRIIRIIAIECMVVIVAITVIGAAAKTHNEFRLSSDGTTTQQSTGSEVNTTSETPQTTTATSTTTEATTAADYEYAYAGFNPKNADMSADISKLVVNGNYTLPENYTPTLSEAVTGSGVQMDYRAAPYYQAMYDAAKEDGITLTPVSGYRSLERQKTNFESRIEEYMDDGMSKKEATIEAAKIIMLPGSSEHNAGLAMDICSLSESFEDTDEFAWLSENAADYGFILRYPKSEEAQAITGVVYEPWHYRFVGVDTAKDIKQKGVTLEEYVGLN